MNQSELYNEKLIEGLLNGRASILVGAGFSLNALRANESVKKDLPLWNGLIDAMYEKLDLAKDRKEYLNPLSVAQQFEEMYGRPVLNKYIKDIMKDDDYIPSKVHKEFLELPWKNVFTTNYDTLLERTCKKIINRKYNIISREDDLLYADGNPKIVKLHGTFPLYDSLIITEEDYRTYPKKHARFVNTVQQALLEDMFCVIGFSGSDPNFLNWIGWIHDNIGLENSPIIYMITDQKKSEAETKSLAAKKIQLIVIDDILKDNESTSTNKKYESYISDLKDQLKKRKKQSTVWITDNDIRYEDYKSENEEQLLNYLKDIHERYLGWIVAPYDYAQRARFILSETNQYYIDKDEKKHQIEISYEYCWLHDICCIPLDISYVRKIEELIHQRIEKGKLDEDQNYKIQYIITILLKFYRLNGEDAEWNRLRKDIDGNENYLLKNNFIYEYAMYSVYHLESAQVKKYIDAIIIQENKPTWALKKASLLTIIGLYKDAKEILEKYLFAVKRTLLDKKYKYDFHALSLENCMTLLYRNICQLTKKEPYSNELIENDVYSVSRKHDFIWDNENQSYILDLRNKIEKEINDKGSKIQFDFDKCFKSIEIVNGRSYERPALPFLIFREATGVPLSIENNIGIIESAYFMSKLSTRIPIALSILSGNKNVVSQIYTRLYISRMDNDKINDLLNFAVSHFEHSLYLAQKSEKIENPLNDSIFRIMFDLISRLYVKNTKNNYQNVINLIGKLFQCNLTFLRDYDKSLSRIITATPLNILYKNKNIFWNIDDVNPKSNLRFFEKFIDRLNYSSNFKPVKEIPDNYKSRFQKYIGKAKKYDIKNLEDQESKKFYIEYLLDISQIYTLANEEKISLKNMLFEKDNMINNLPYTGDYFPFVLDDIIEYDYQYLDIEWKNTLDKIKKCINDYILSTSLEQWIKEGTSILEKLKPNKEQVISLINVIKSACDKRVEEKSHFSSINNEGFIEINDNVLMNAGFLLARAIDKSETNVSKNKDVNEILSKLKDNKIPCAYLEYTLNNRIPFEEFDNVRVNFNDKSFNESMIAISYLIKEGKVDIVNDELIEELISSISKVDDLQVEQILKSLNELASYHKISETVLNNLSDKLTFVYEVTDYSKATDDSIVQKMFVRQALTSLLYTLKENYPNFKIDIKPYSNTNEFAEVRNAWYDRDFIKSLNPKKQSDDNEE